jgi:phosphoribosylaminoimidazolecarboxamide formyltransferase / IMP cyclohydrolase
MFKRALISVSDKQNLIPFLKPLVESGMEIVSTGGTAKYLREQGWHVTDISEVTHFPEILDGRVKTLHPFVHMGLLAKLSDPSHLGALKEHKVKAFDLVVGNLYPFEKAVQNGADEEELIENIDIGGPSFLRSASKNFETIAVVCNPQDYSWIQEKNYKLTRDDRKLLASKVFRMVSAYDSLISDTLNPVAKDSKGEIQLSNPWTFAASLKSQLRYGENSHQSAFWYESTGARDGLTKAKILQGKELSYNNILDLEASFQLCQKFSEPCVVAVKHNNPCGVAVDLNPVKAVEKALKSDPVSVFGGIIAINVPVSAEMAKLFSQVFLECILAPKFEAGALEVFGSKKNLRLLEWDFRNYTQDFEFRSVSGGTLIQMTDMKFSKPSEWQVIGELPTEEMTRTMIFGEKVCAQLKSNAIALVSDGQTIGLGMGQVNRVDAVEHAITRWKSYHASQKNVVLISDAFFPFADSIEKAAQAGIKWVFQPGGSVKDEEVKQVALRLGVNLILTGIRHFKH